MKILDHKIACLTIHVFAAGNESSDVETAVKDGEEIGKFSNVQLCMSNYHVN